MDLKIEEVADLLSVSKATILRWLAERKIPAYRMNNQYRFSRFEIEDWMMSHKPNEDRKKDSFCKNEEEAADLAVKSGRKQFSLYRAIHKGGVLHKVEGKTKSEVITNAMRLIAEKLNLDAEVITELLLDREQLQPTALGHGIGLPHPRDCLLPSGQNVVVPVFLARPVPYGALDGQPVHTLFFLFASEDKNHLHLLAKIAHFSNQKESVEFLLSRPKKQELLEYIKVWESKIQGVEVVSA